MTDMTEGTTAPKPGTPSGGDVQPSTSAPDQGTPSGVEQRLAEMEDRMKGMRTQLGEQGNSLKEYDRLRSALATFPERDKFLKWYETGEMPKTEPPADGGDESRTDALLERALLEGDTEAFQRYMQQHDVEVLKKAGALGEDTRKSVSTLAAQSAIDRFFRRPDVDSAMASDDSPFWEYCTNFLKDPANDWIESVFREKPDKAIEIVYLNFAKEKGDPLELRRKTDALRLKKDASSGPLPAVTLAEVVRAKGRHLRMREVNEEVRKSMGHPT
jgi:hypothetical protein